MSVGTPTAKNTKPRPRPNPGYPARRVPAPRPTVRPRPNQPGWRRVVRPGPNPRIPPSVKNIPTPAWLYPMIVGANLSHYFFTYTLGGGANWEKTAECANPIVAPSHYWFGYDGAPDPSYVNGCAPGFSPTVTPNTGALPLPDLTTVDWDWYNIVGCYKCGSPWKWSIKLEQWERTASEPVTYVMPTVIAQPAIPPSRSYPRPEPSPGQGRRNRRKRRRRLRYQLSRVTRLPGTHIELSVNKGGKTKGGKGRRKENKLSANSGVALVGKFLMNAVELGYDIDEFVHWAAQETGFDATYGCIGSYRICAYDYLFVGGHIGNLDPVAALEWWAYNEVEDFVAGKLNNALRGAIDDLGGTSYYKLTNPRLYNLIGIP